MEHTREELLEAKRQITSTVHKLKGVIKTLEAKGEPKRYRSQITLTKRRVQAFSLADSLIEERLKELEIDKNEREGESSCPRG